VTVAPRRRENPPVSKVSVTDILADAAKVREENARLLKQLATNVPGPPVEPLATVLEAESEQDNESSSSPSKTVAASVLSSSAVAVPAIPSPPVDSADAEEELHAKEVNKLLDMVDTLSRMGYDAAPIKGAVDRLSNLSLRAQSITQRLPSPLGAIPLDELEGQPPLPQDRQDRGPANPEDSPGLPPRLL
jgi:hypothetical protein